MVDGLLLSTLHILSVIKLYIHTLCHVILQGLATWFVLANETWYQQRLKTCSGSLAYFLHAGDKPWYMTMSQVVAAPSW